MAIESKYCIRVFTSAPVLWTILCLLFLTLSIYLSPIQNWVTCSVNIQAIKCFPCYLKISFYNHDDNSTVDHHPFSVIRINIPGIKLESAASRTKTHTYGLFWKNNRKKCKMFFAFKEREDYKTHMDWLQSRIVSLEKYRKGDY